MAIEGLVLLHTPPPEVSARVNEAPTQTEDAPVIVPAIGSTFTVTNLIELDVPQLFVTVYLIVSIPGETFVITPPETVAMRGLVLLQAPTPAVSVNVKTTPTHPIDGPVMIPEFGNGFTVISCIATVVPQTFVAVYFTVSTPDDIPVTTPLITVAIPVLTLQEPPAVVSDNVIDEPTQTLDGPEITPA